MWKRYLYVVFILFCLEIGLFLVFLPWSSIWDKNSWLLVFPRFRPYLLSGYARGAMSGLGLVNIWVGLSDIRHYRANIAAIEREEAEIVAREKAAEAAADAGQTVPPSRQTTDAGSQKS